MWHLTFDSVGVRERMITLAFPIIKRVESTLQVVGPVHAHASYVVKGAW